MQVFDIRSSLERLHCRITIGRYVQVLRKEPEDTIGWELSQIADIVGRFTGNLQDTKAFIREPRVYVDKIGMM